MAGAPVLGRMARRVASMQDLSSLKFTVPLETLEMRQGEDGTPLLHPLPVVEAHRCSVEGEHFGVGGVRQRN